jgi:hypothetical protein
MGKTYSPCEKHERQTFSTLQGIGIDSSHESQTTRNSLGLHREFQSHELDKIGKIDKNEGNSSKQNEQRVSRFK